jgi:hypothetical protein
MLRIKSAQAKYEETFEVRKDGRLLFRGPEAECWHYIHKHTSSSVDWAMKYEGWTITPSGSDWRDSYQWYGEPDSTATTHEL